MNKIHPTNTVVSMIIRGVQNPCQNSIMNRKWYTVDMQSIVPIVTNLGFPITACFALGYFVWKFANKLSQDSIDRENKMMDYFNKQNTVLSTMSANMEKMGNTLDNMNQRLILVESKVEDKVHS